MRLCSDTRAMLSSSKTFSASHGHLQPYTSAHDAPSKPTIPQSSPQHIQPNKNTQTTHVNFCMDLLLLDDIVPMREQFQHFCREVYTLQNHVDTLVRCCQKKWHPDMHDDECKQAALLCVVVTWGFEKVMQALGNDGKKAFSLKIFKHGPKIPHRVQLVWSYIEWKILHDSSNTTRRRGNKSVWDDIFTPEAVCVNPDIRCAVKVGMHAVKVSRERALSVFKASVASCSC